MTTTSNPPPFDPARLEEVFLKVRPKLKRILAFQRIPPEDADDLIQEAVIASIRRWDSIIDLEAWIFGALRKRCSVYRRSQRVKIRRMEMVSPAVLEAIVESEWPPQEREDMRREIDQAATYLAFQHRAILLMRYRLGYSVIEIAERLKYTPSSVRKLSGRAIARIKKRLEEAVRPPVASPDEVGPKPAYPPR